MSVTHGSAASQSSWLHKRELPAYPADGARRFYLLLVVAITVALYYELYVSGGVAVLMLEHFEMPFNYFVTILAVSNLVGAFASLLAGFCDRFGRANLVVYGLLLVGLITLFGIPNAPDKFTFGVLNALVAFVEGIILVATPALIRDFSPQVGRATAMGFWTVGPVLGSLMVSLLTTLTLDTTKTWQSQYRICGAIGLVVFVVAFFALRELAPALRDQIMVSLRDRALVEAKARGLDTNTKAPFRQLMHLDIVGSALGVSVLLLFYYTAVAFGTIYMVTIFHFTLAQANTLANWTWGANAVALIIAGMASDKLGVRKPFMLVGGIGALVVSVLFLLQAGQPTTWTTLMLLSVAQSILVGTAYATWMASFTETIEAHNPALTATGLAIWGWLLRLVITASFLAIPHVVNSVTPLIDARHTLAALARAKADGVSPSPDLVAHLATLKQAVAESPGQWQAWYWFCASGILVFVLSIFIMRGRWSPAAAKADARAHDALVTREMAGLSKGLHAAE